MSERLTPEARAQLIEHVGCGDFDTYGRCIQCNQIRADLADNDALRAEVEQWRSWAQFVWLGGGPVTMDDKALQAAMCAMHDAEVETLRLDELQRQNAIITLAVPLEDELSDRIDEICKHLAMEDGFTLAGIARVFIECQRRMAVDWLAIGQERRERKAAEQERDEAQAKLAEAERLVSEWATRVRDVKDHDEAGLLNDCVAELRAALLRQETPR